MTGDPREEDKRSPTETTRVAVGAAPNVAGWSNTGSLSGLGGWGVGAIEWVGPQILTLEARLSGEGGFPINEDKIDRWGLRYVKDNRDIGRRPGPRSAATFVLEQAEEKLKAGYSGTKTALAEGLSALVKQRYRFTDELTMCPENVERIITPLWRRFRGDAV